MNIKNLYNFFKSRKNIYMILIDLIISFIIIYFGYRYIVLSIFFSSILTSFLIIILFLLSLINIYLFVYQIFELRRLPKKSLLSIIGYLLGFGSLQGCFILFCNPGLIYSILLTLFPYIFYRYLAYSPIISTIFIGISDLILLIILIITIKQLQKIKKKNIYLSIKK